MRYHLSLGHQYEFCFAIFLRFSEHMKNPQSVKYRVPQILQSSCNNSVDLFQSLICQDTAQIKLYISEQYNILTLLVQKIQHVELCDNLIDYNIRQLNCNVDKISKYLKYYYKRPNRKAK
ncbi:Hypothetical_protein [Hexamita inflata]|uniref:Hypothetical_protein n=1 Tax=Hexamita inflata TaxID=28002 RepID=A0AA86N4I3_9EUKA|nr:Hypothetical protein HINF_LOCUS427 [Hexamita inflata]